MLSKRKQRFCCAMSLMLLICFSGNVAMASQLWRIEDAPDTTPSIQGSVEVSYHDLLVGGLLLVNQAHPMPQTIQEETLIFVGAQSNQTIQTTSDQVCLLPCAYDAVSNLLLEAEQMGQSFYLLREGYRSYESQQALYEMIYEQVKEKFPSFTPEECMAETIKQVSYPGTSEYQTGLSMSMDLFAVGRSFELFHETAQGKWWLENCDRYGLILRYPIQSITSVWGDKSAQTGVESTLSLYRYVGIPHATLMKQLTLCLEEYVQYLSDHPHLQIYVGDQLRYEILRIPTDGVAEMVTIPLLTDTHLLQASFDNIGGVVLTYEYNDVVE